MKVLLVNKFHYRKGGSETYYFTLAEAVIRQAGCKVSVTTKDGVARITRGDSDSLRLMDRIGMDFRNGSVVSVLMQFGYQGGA